MSGDEHRNALMAGLDEEGDGCYVPEKQYTLRGVAQPGVSTNDDGAKYSASVTALGAQGAGSGGVLTPEEEDAQQSAAAAAYYANTTGYGDYTQYGTAQEPVEAAAGDAAGEGEGDIGIEGAEAVRRMLEEVMGDGASKGSDVQVVAEVPSEMDDLVRYLTPSELAYCEHAPDKAASRAGRIAAKNAVAAALRREAKDLYRDIEVVPSSTHAPAVMLTGDALEAAQELGDDIAVKVTISHSGAFAIAAAIAVKERSS